MLFRSELPAHTTDPLPQLMGEVESASPDAAAEVPTAIEASAEVVAEVPTEVPVEEAPAPTAPLRADATETAAPVVLEVFPAEPAVTRAPAVTAATTLLPPRAEITPVMPRMLETAKETPVSLISARVDDDEDEVPDAPTAHAASAAWLVKGLAAVAVIEAVVIGALLMRSPSPAAPASAPASLSVTLDAQPGSTVFIDERPAGTTPLKLSLNAATRSIRLAAPAAAPVAATAAPASGNDATAAALAQAAARQRSGGIRLNAPIDLQVLEGNRVLGTSADGPIVAPAGSHPLDFVNSAVGFRVRQSVTKIGRAHV